MKRQETWECDDFPRARLSFERAPYFRPTHFASVGNILKAVDEENRVTLVIAISVLQFGQILVVGTTENARLTVMTLPSARQMSGRTKKAHPGLGACQSGKQELEIARSLCASGSITDMVRLLSTRVEKKVTTSPDGRLSRSSLEQQSHRPQRNDRRSPCVPG